MFFIPKVSLFELRRGSRVHNYCAAASWFLCCCFLVFSPSASARFKGKFQEYCCIPASSDFFFTSFNLLLFFLGFKKIITFMENICLKIYLIRTFYVLVTMVSSTLNTFHHEGCTRQCLNELQKEYCVNTKIIALDWQWVTLRSLCKMNRKGHSSPVMH